MVNKEYAIPKYVTSNDLKRIRKKLKLSQKEFAKLINCSTSTIERWEAKDEKIDGPIVLLLNMLENNLEYVDKITVPERKTPLRLKYMHNQKLCTIIDVNMSLRKVKIKNFTNIVLFRAFGNVLEPTYEDYEEFLESRCFPRTRDKLKLVLEDLDLPFYEPLLIIRKTQGRMAEDDFWIDIEED